MLSSVLGTKLKLEGTIRYIVIMFFADMSYIAHNRKSSRQVLHIFRSEHGKHFFYTRSIGLSIVLLFFAPLWAVQVAQRFIMKPSWDGREGSRI